MKKNLFLILMAAYAVLFGQEMLKNSSFDQKNIWQDAGLSQPAGHFAGSKFTEDKTWNNCLKLELKKLANGQVGAVLLIGKDGKKVGFAAKPETTYEFSLEAKGTVPGVTTAAMLYHNDDPAWKSGASKRVKTTLGNFRTPAEWTKFRGTFRTGSDTVRAALVLQFWANREMAKKWKPGQYLLVDNVSIKERKAVVTEPAAGAPQNAAAVPAFLAGDPNTFGQDIPFEVRSEDGNAVVTATLPDSTPKKTVAANGSGIWADDVVEVFFLPRSCLPPVRAGVGRRQIFARRTERTEKLHELERLGRGAEIHVRNPVETHRFRSAAGDGAEIQHRRPVRRENAFPAAGDRESS